MARTTVDDCIKHCPNHFELAFGTMKRARALRAGKPSDLKEEKDTYIVHALREIAQGLYSVNMDETIESELVTDDDLNINTDQEASDAEDESEQSESSEPSS